MIDYVENPDKTVAKDDDLKDLYHVFEYTTHDKKTANKQYVSGINCLPEIALRQMIITKKQFSKTDKRIAYHGYQSFAPGEVNADTAHEIGKEFAKQMWGDRFQIIVTTHLDKDHLHNHICFNSVSFLDGKKYNFSKQERRKMIKTSDEICKSYGLSVIENYNKTATPRNIYLDEKQGKPTQYSLMRDVINEALQNAYTFPQLKTYLTDYGYEVDFYSKYPGIKLPYNKYFTRFTTIDESLTIDFIKERMRYNAGIQRRYKAPSPPAIPYEIKREWQHKKATGLKALYLYYCYQLGILPKKTSYKPIHPALLEDIKKMETISKQTNLLYKKDIKTTDELDSYMDSLNDVIDTLTAGKIKLQNQVRRAKEPEKVLLRTEKERLTAKIKELKFELKLCEGIKERSEKVNQVAEIVTKQQDKVKKREYAR